MSLNQKLDSTTRYSTLAIKSRYDKLPRRWRPRLESASREPENTPKISEAVPSGALGVYKKRTYLPGMLTAVVLRNDYRSKTFQREKKPEAS